MGVLTEISGQGTKKMILQVVILLVLTLAGVDSQNRRPTISFITQPEVVLKCYASGYPPPGIYWRRQNNVQLPTGGLIYKGNVLTMEKVERMHRGTYYCVATNVVGTGARRNIDVEVEHTPSIKIPRKRLGQALQFDMDLECQIDAYPPPAITWYKVYQVNTQNYQTVSEALTTNQHYRISHFAHDDQYVDTILRVVTIEKKQYGKYLCKATNRLGSANRSVELFETVIPICPPACDEVNYSSPASKQFAPAMATLALLALLARL